MIVENAIRVVEDNVEATEAWNGPLFDIWIEYRDIVAEGLRDHGESALAANPPCEGDRVLDIGCGLGDTTVRLAGLVGAAGHAHGVDVAERMIETAIEEAAEAGLTNVSFATCDVEVTKFDQMFDYAYSRMGTMFFANPVAALRNVREALTHGGLLNMVVWRRKLDNEFMHRAELVVAEYLEEPEESDVPRCGPGPFSMANADTVTDVLKSAGYEDIRLARQDLPYKIGNDLEQAVGFNMALGPAAEVLRMWGERVDDIRPKIADDLRAALSDYVVDGGAVVAPASTWAVTARARDSAARRDELIAAPPVFRRSVRVLVLPPSSGLGVVTPLRRPLEQERVVRGDKRVGRHHRIGVVDGSVFAREGDPARALAQAVLELGADLL